MQFHFGAELRTVSSMKAEGRVVAEWCRQGETLPSSVPFTPQPAGHPQTQRHPRPAPEKAAHPIVKVGGLEPTEEGDRGNRARGPCGPGLWPGQLSAGNLGAAGGAVHVAPASGGPASAVTGTRECRQWGLGPERRPLPARRTVAAPQTLAGVPPTIQALLHPHTPPAAAEPVNQGTSGKAKGARHADAPGQDTRDTGSLALKTTEARQQGHRQHR